MSMDPRAKAREQMEGWASALQSNQLEQAERLWAPKEWARAGVDWSEPIRGRAELVWAARNRRPKEVQELLELGADVNQKDAEGRSPLMGALMALSAGDRSAGEEVVDALMAAGAEVSAKDEEGKFPLWWAAYFGGVELCRKLIQAGARVNETDKKGVDALMMAAMRGGQATCELLLGAGAKLSNRSSNGTSAEWSARACGHKKLASWLKKRERAEIEKKGLEAVATRGAKAGRLPRI